MDWKMQLGISIVVPVISSLLTYLAAIRKSKDDIKAVQIKADNEIQKIIEASDKEIERMKVNTEEQIKLKLAERDLALKENEEKMKNEMASKFLGGYFQDPQKGAETLESLANFAKQFGVKENNK